jgi:hypothetical protein
MPHFSKLTGFHCLFILVFHKGESMKRKLLALLTILVLVGMLPGAALASPGEYSVSKDAEFVPKNDNLSDPLTSQ